MSKNIELVKRQDLQEPRATAERDEVGLWEQIDGWDSTSHTVEIFWRVEGNENRFALDLVPTTDYGDRVSVDVTFEEVQAIRHEQHTYPYIAPKVGHLATVEALGIPEAA